MSTGEGPTKTPMAQGITVAQDRSPTKLQVKSYFLAQKEKRASYSSSMDDLTSKESSGFCSLAPSPPPEGSDAPAPPAIHRGARKSEMQLQRQEIALLKETARTLEEKRDKLLALVQERKEEISKNLSPENISKNH